MSEHTLKTFLVAVDGSKTSREALDMCCEYLMHHNDRVVVTHIFDRSKAYLPAAMQPEAIREEVEVALIPRFPHAKWELNWVPKDPQKTTRQAIMEVVHENKIDVLIVGFHGRKGPKSESTVMGTSTEYAIRSSRCPLLVHKKHFDGVFVKWYICVDGSTASQQAFKVVCGLLNAVRGDNIVLLHVDGDQDVTTALEKRYTNLLDELQVPGEFRVLIPRAGVTVVDTLVSTINESDCDIVVFGADGVTAMNQGVHFLGSVSNGLMSRTRCSCLIVK
eukprot:GILJ01001100.1.p1 GENE.GILJ01001100.1~~GILJ01001100.1.p1  ORF type:complete len:276 (-),score=46.09 GILJ01001100.1:168-995(-)